MSNMPRQKAQKRFVLCVNNADYPASLEVRKVYATKPDTGAEAVGFVRVVDESGEDYLYPESLFITVELPQAAAKVVLSAAS